LKRAYASGIPFDGPEEGVDTPELRQLLRTAAADATVLLKNDQNILPLSSKGDIKKIAVIGPNAKQAMTSGGGSARLLSTYTVSPLEGISAVAKEIGAEVTYGIGATSHKFLPLLDPYIKQEDGQPGALIEFWNDSPGESFLKTDADVGKPVQQCVWSTRTGGSNCFLMDGIVSLDASWYFWKCF
jgi:beta-glucosidase